MFFGWFSKMAARRAARRFERERALFRFWDGTGWRSIDPWRTWRAVQNCKTFSFANQLFLVDAGEDQETNACIAALCEIFGVQRFDGTAGLTDWEILSLYLSLSDYLDALKKNTSPGPTSSPPSDPPSSTSPASPGEATNSSSACSSTPNEANCGNPTAS